MKQTHIVKLDAPYMIVWNPDKLEMAKHMATLIEVDENQEGELVTVEHIVDDRGHVWHWAELDDHIDVCREYESIDLLEFDRLMFSVRRDQWSPNGLFSINYLAMLLEYYGIDVELPGEKEANGEEWEITTHLNLGQTDNVFWVEDGVENFSFGTRKNSLAELGSYIVYTRNEYYRAFPNKKFRIVFTTKCKEWQDFVDKINASQP